MIHTNGGITVCPIFVKISKIIAPVHQADVDVFDWMECKFDLLVSLGHKHQEVLSSVDHGCLQTFMKPSVDCSVSLCFTHPHTHTHTRQTYNTPPLCLFICMIISSRPKEQRQDIWCNTIAGSAPRGALSALCSTSTGGSSLALSLLFREPHALSSSCLEGKPSALHHRVFMRAGNWFHSQSLHLLHWRVLILVMALHCWRMCSLSRDPLTRFGLFAWCEQWWLNDLLWRSRSEVKYVGQAMTVKSPGTRVHVHVHSGWRMCV